MVWLPFVIGAVVLAGLCLHLLERVRVMERRLVRMHDLLRQVGERVGLPEEDPLEAELRQMVAEGRHIEAIQRLRQATGMSLKEAKEYVEAL